MEDGAKAGTLAALAAALVLVAGILHLVLAQTHMEESRGQGLFFVSLGAAQVVWPVLFLRRDTPRLWAFGLAALAVMPVAVYVATRFVAAPYAESEGWDLIGLATIGPEAAAAVALAMQGAARGLAWDRPALGPWALAGVLAAGGVLLAGVLLAAGFATEGVEWLAEGEEHQHGSGEEGGHAHLEAADSLAAGPGPVLEGLTPAAQRDLAGQIAGAAGVLPAA